MNAREILDVINRRNRCKIAVKGAIAEAHLLKHLEQLRSAGSIDAFEDFDLDGHPDFRVTYKGQSSLVECKNVRKTMGSGKFIEIDFQRTRNQKAGPQLRFYAPSEFEVIAASLWNQTKTWEFRFAATKDLAPHNLHQGRLAPKQVVDMTPSSFWTACLPELLQRLSTDSVPSTFGSQAQLGLDESKPGAN